MSDDTSGSTTSTLEDDRDEPVHRADRVAIRVMAVIAILVAAVSAVLGAVRTGMWLSGADMPMELLTRVPLEDAAGGEAEVTSAAYTRIELIAQSLSGGTRALYGASELIGGLTIAIVAVAAAVLLRRVAQGLPFHRSLFVAGLVSGIAIIFGGMIGGALRGFATMNGAAEVAVDLPVPVVVGFDIDLAFLAGFVLLAISLVFRAGSRLQRDTAGLV